MYIAKYTALKMQIIRQTFGDKVVHKQWDSAKRNVLKLKTTVSKPLTFSESVEPLSRNRDPNLTQNEHVYAIFCRPEVAGDVVSGGNVKTVDDYVVLNCEAARVGNF